ncbi:MAG TPA: elongation factor 1-beta [Candidatus Nanoarchaeia archaeon]|nr:elongation factor 1-beta [Candidatus Nanoarchaeia archaeon]
MASVVVTLKVMPTAPETNLDEVFTHAEKCVRLFVDAKHKDGEVRKGIEPIGYGLKALKIVFVMDESLGTTDRLEENIKKVAGVESVEATDVRRAIG